MAVAHLPSHTSGTATKTGIVVLNWRNADDTIACLSSLNELTERRWNVYILDNGSDDGSLERLTEWCRRHASPQALYLTRCRSADVDVEYAPQPPEEYGRLVVVAIDTNTGFAKGNNVGIRLALDDACDFIWVLNNDTIVDRESLSHLVATALRHETAGMVGCCVMEYAHRDVVQCLGGARFNWLLTTKHPIGQGIHLSEVGPQCCETTHLDYVTGASMFLPARAIRQVGLLSEEYFLYHEELDYAQRCLARGLTLRTSCAARVYHKYGASLGSSSDISKKSSLSAYYGTRSLVVFIRKFRPALLPMTVIVRCVWIMTLGARGHWKLARAAFGGLIDGVRAAHTTQPTRPSHMPPDGATAITGSDHATSSRTGSTARNR
jgi:GT2 family glycosyltransferase